VGAATQRVRVLLMLQFKHSQPGLVVIQQIQTGLLTQERRTISAEIAAFLSPLNDSQKLS